MEFANSVVTLIGNIFSCGLILAFLIGLIYGIRFMLRKRQVLGWLAFAHILLHNEYS